MATNSTCPDSTCKLRNNFGYCTSSGPCIMATKRVKIPAKVEKASIQRGKWIENSDPGETYKAHWKCSNCEQGLGLTEDWIRLFKYCPMCGIKMDLEETKDNGTDNP